MNDELKQLNSISPKFPRTRHAPLSPNATRDDLIASETEFWADMKNPDYHVELSEKMDGSNCGISIHEGQPLIRNRNKVLSKNYSNRRTPAKAQFSPIWNWYYENKDRFQMLESMLGFVPRVYGEWLYAQHSVSYNKLPSLFMAFDVYDGENKEFISPQIYRPALEASGFSAVSVIEMKDITEESLMKARNGKSFFSDEIREGIYIKVCDGKKIVSRYKMVRQDFIQGEHWNKRGTLIKNEVQG